jgi:hypothetical protein
MCGCGVVLIFLQPFMPRARISEFNFREAPKTSTEYLIPEKD